MVEEACQVLGVEPRISAVSPLMMRVVGLFVPAARASVEMMYEFTAPFVVDSSRIEREFSLSATPIPAAIERTIEWYRNHVANR
jgi:nucleoside-diphosphate-sugar epimerase